MCVCAFRVLSPSEDIPPAAPYFWTQQLQRRCLRPCWSSFSRQVKAGSGKSISADAAALLLAKSAQTSTAGDNGFALRTSIDKPQ